MTALTDFSIIPLRIASVVGLACAMLGFVFGLVVIIRKLVNPAISEGYSSMIAVMLFIGGVIMMILGILGEYVGRIYMTISDLPQYNVRQTRNTPVRGSGTEGRTLP